MEKKSELETGLQKLSGGELLSALVAVWSR